MPIVRDNAMQSIFAAAQAVVIVAGAMFTAATPRMRGGGDGPWLPVFVRDWGFLLLLIPVVWVFTTLWLERHRSDWFTARWTILSGVLLLAALVLLMVQAFTRASLG